MTWGHYGSDQARRLFYHRLEPAWTAEPPMRGEFFTGVRDLMNFSQTWARYSAVRDGQAMFEGHVYRQYRPSRARAGHRISAELDDPTQ